MASKQIQRAEALQHIASMRERVLTLREQMEPLPYGLAQHVDICLHSLHLFEGEVSRHYRWNEESP